MTLLEKLQARLKTTAGDLDVLMAKDAVSAEDLAMIKAKTDELKDLEDQISTLKAAEEAKARTAVPANSPVGSTPATVAEKLTAEDKFGIICMGIVHAKQNEGTSGVRPVLRSISELNYDAFAKDLGLAQRTVNSASASNGGILVPENMASEMIDLLRPNATFLSGMPRRIPMPNGTYKVPAAATGATAAYRGETAPAAVSSPTFKSISMSAKLLAGVVMLSEEIVRWSLPDVRAWVQSDLLQAMATKMDHAAYFGDGLEDTPLGITNIAGTVSVAAYDSTTPTVTQIETSARSIERQMFSTNLPQLGVRWVMSLRTFQYLADLRDGNGNLYYPTLQLANPTWRSRPVMVTNQISDTGGVGTNESKILLVAFGHVMFGDAMSVSLSVSDQATIVNGSTTVNTWQDGVMAIKATAAHDFDTRYLEAVGQLTAVKWGA